MIKKAVMTYLLANVSNTRLHYTGAPPGTESPYGVLTIVSSPRSDTHEGDDGLTEARVQIDWFAETDTEVESLFQETQTAMKNFVGVRSGVAVSRCHLDDEADNYEHETSLFHKSLDYLIQYEE